MAEDAEEDALHLRVTVGDITVEVEGPVDDAETWFEALREDYLSEIDPDTFEAAANGGNPSPSNTERGSNSAVNSTTGTGCKDKSLSLAEYYRQLNNPTKKDSAFLVGWYLEYQEDQENFTRSEVEGRAQDAKISLGANVGRDLSSHIEEGRLEKVEERDGYDAFHLTVTGEEYLEDDLGINEGTNHQTQ